jgi:RNA polymerase sigma-70 factor (ECF subfamily)
MVVGSEATPPDPADPAGPGQPQRYAAMYRRHVRAVHNYAWRRVGDAAADVVSETFLVAWRRMPELPDDEELPWLLGVARRVVANAVRARARDVRLDRHLRAALAAGVGVVEPDHAQLLCARDEVLTCLARLNPRDQESLQLVAWEGLEIRDAARVVGCSVTAFTVRLHRARRRLAQLLNAGDDEDAAQRAVIDAQPEGSAGPGGVRRAVRPTRPAAPTGQREES